MGLAYNGLYIHLLFSFIQNSILKKLSANINYNKYMYIIEVGIENVLKECPFAKDWIDVINKNIKKSNFPVSKIESYYDYGFFVPASKNTQENYLINLQKSMNMMFDERLTLELSKVRVTLTLKMGNTMITQRLPKGFIPDTVKEIITEITKIRMSMECDDHGNEEIRGSIPELNPNIVVEFLDNPPREESELEIDDILDKISNSGYDSLTKEEKEFLDKKSKDI
jgi:hypothetical protein